MRRLASNTTLWAIGILTVVIVSSQVWTARENTKQVARIVAELSSIDTQQMSSEKNRQEIISLRIQNELKAFFWNSLISALGPMVAALVALIGAWVGLRNYLDTREKERTDRAAGDLGKAIEYLASKEPLERAVGIVSLQHFLTPDKEEYHLRALSPLIAVARLEEDKEVQRTIQVAVEEAVRNLPEEILQRVTWQHVKLKGVSLRNQLLRGIDFRSADLEDADFTGCDLSGSMFTDARLKGAKFDGAILREADLAYADFAGASLVGADLRRATLHRAKVWGMNLERADLRQAKFFDDEIQWHLIKNWRDATYDAGLLTRLLERYGPTVAGTRVLMLMWEIPPLIAGGTWTASFHLVRNLRKAGANVTVVVPWDERDILPRPFGCEVEVIPLGIDVDSLQQHEPWDSPPWSPYSTSGVFQPWSPYSTSGFSQPWSPYSTSGFSQPWSPYSTSGFSQPWSPYSHLSPIYSTYSASGRRVSSYEEAGFQLRHGSTLLWLIQEFQKRFLRFAEHQDFGIIHAHDWVTFEAAYEASRRLGKPWVAHVHSIEADRRGTTPDIIVQRIEQKGIQSADRIVVPSKYTSARVQSSYGVPDSRITVAPNQLSFEDVDIGYLGSFESKRVIFLGRLAYQKGPDRFAAIARRLKSRLQASFVMFGAGPEAASLRWEYDVVLRGPMDWSARSTAFSGASAVLVPSRSEPFGMVVLEAMQHRVPVLYPEHSGVAEVISSGIRIDPEQMDAMSNQLEQVLTDWKRWEEVVEAQYDEISTYADRGYELLIMELWKEMVPSRVEDHTAPQPIVTRPPREP